MSPARLVPVLRLSGDLCVLNFWSEELIIKKMEYLCKVWGRSNVLNRIDDNEAGHVELESLLGELTFRGQSQVRKIILDTLTKRPTEVTAILARADVSGRGIWLPDALALEFIALLSQKFQDWMNAVNTTVHLGRCSFSISGGVGASMPRSQSPEKEPESHGREVAVSSGQRLPELVLRGDRTFSLPDTLDDVLELARKEKLPAGNLLFKEEDVENTGRERVPRFNTTGPSRVPELRYEETEEPLLHIDDWMTSRVFMQNVAQITSCTPLTGSIVPDASSNALLDSNPSSADPVSGPRLLKAPEPSGPLQDIEDMVEDVE